MIPSLRSAVNPAVTVDDSAENAIRDYCGWHIAPVIQQSLVLDGNGQKKILLPSRKIVSVESAKVLGAPVEFRFSEDGWLNVPSGIPHAERCLEVTLTHGFEQTPPVVSQVASAMVARARMSPAGNIVNQRAGTQSVTFASNGGSVASFPLMDAEKELLAPYKLNWGP